MATLHSDNFNYDDEEFTEFSEFEIKANSKKRDKRRNSKIMKKQQRLKNDDLMSEDYNSHTY